MELMQTVMDGISRLGVSFMLPVVVILLSLLLKISFGKALKSGLLIGAGFVGINLIIEMMNTGLGEAAAEMSRRFGLGLSVVDIGWQGAAPMVWASPIAAAAIPVAVLVNVAMVLLKLTRTVNIDIWNIWHMTFTGAIAYAVTGNFLIGILGVAVHGAVSYKLGDLWAPYIEEYFELEGMTVPHGTSSYMAPVACVVELVIGRIPVLKEIDFSAEKLQEKVGALAEPVVIGTILGAVIGILAGYPLYDALPLGVEMGAVMALMPKIVSFIMQGLTPLSQRIRDILSRHFGNEGISIGLDPSVLLGDPQVVAAGLLFIPLTLILAVLVPGNRVLPFGDLATISFFVAISVAVHHGNLFRTLISGSIIMYVTIWIANQTIPWMNALSRITDTVSASGKVAALDQGGCPITYIYTQLFTRENIGGFLAIGIGYLLCIGAAVICSKKEKEKIEEIR